MGVLPVISIAASPDMLARTRGWEPFLTAMPVWDYWFWLLIPLALGVALVYKSTKCNPAGRIVAEAIVLAAWIVGGLIAAAVGIAVVVRFV